ncbi:MAG: energy transducer TonB [Gammaproteobacteria bacterium]|nr:energy transducer TonB [Gammaproteobacteria bacterium]NNF60900.1 energy transducer TonB [Gammaproteobacteria bacterium]NNM20519.1 energy transducer TonB [Gammaproteobacteria bacterium]
MHRLLALLAMLAAATAPALAEEGDTEAGNAPDDRPVAIEKAEPEYPKRAYNKCIEGHVLVRFVIATDGTTKDIEVLSSRPERVFDKAAIAAVEKWRFEPRILNGMPVQRESTQRLVFEPGCIR